MQPWVCFSSSSGETFRALYTQVPTKVRASLRGFFVDRECGAESVARELVGDTLVERFERKTFEAPVLERLRQLAGEVPGGELCVFLCGYFGILSANFLEQCPGPIVNTHPSLLPSFPGLDQKVHRKAAESVAISGFTVHLVTEELDGGPVLFQHPVMLDASLEWEQNRARVRAAEQRYLPAMLEQTLRLQLKAQDRKCSSIELRRRLGFNLKTFGDLALPELERFQRSPHVV
jgi:folate-dependent phosphoribosylglycinamide formyltransferase PurN